MNETAILIVLQYQMYSKDNENQLGANLGR
jgi:hypothetical protein